MDVATTTGHARNTPETLPERDNWALLVDPDWIPESEDQVPPAEVMAGGWLIDKEGKPGLFTPNPEYVPRTANGPTDPTDAVLRLISDEKAPPEALIPTFRNAYVQVAVTEDGQLLVGPAPDEAPCVAVVTAALYRKQLPFEHWREVTAETLARVLPEDTDILLNATGPAPFRLMAEALRRSIEQDPDNVAGAPAPEESPSRQPEEHQQVTR